jgi:hypothetical protein
MVTEHQNVSGTRRENGVSSLAPAQPPADTPDAEGLSKQLNRRIDDLCNRFEDFRMYSTVALGLATVIFGLVAVIFKWDVNTEKTRIMDMERHLEEEVRAELGKLEKPPRVEINNKGQALAGQLLPASLRGTPEGKPGLYIQFALNNAGESSSGPLFMKLYASDPVKLLNASTDQPEFKYEGYITPADLAPNELPGGMSVEMDIFFYLEGDDLPPPGKYPALLKVFYGRGKVATAAFTLEAKSDAR